MRWKYQVLKLSEDFPKSSTLFPHQQVEAGLNSAGGAGWELVHQYERDGDTFFVLKQPAG